MAQCRQCKREYDDKVAMGICPFCGAENFSTVSDTARKPKEEMQRDPRWHEPGVVLNGRYRVETVIGVGGFGITYKCYDMVSGVEKAVKEYFQQGVVNRIPGTTEVLVSAHKRQEEFEYGKERLLREARIVAKFQSKSIVRVEDYFEENNTSYMVMEYLASQTLEEYMVSHKRLLSVEEAIHIGVKICEALEEIHAAGVIHRDIAPDNIFFDAEGNVKIIDFGSARLSKEDIDDRLIVLKPGFAPPEQYEKIDLQNDKQRAWTDVYALGAVLYFVLTGRIPAEASDRKADFDMGTDRVCYPKEINPNIPDFLNNTIMTAMAINIHERFQNATQLKQALLQERKVLPLEKARKRKKFRRTAGIGISFLLVAALVCFGAYRYLHPDDALEAAEISIWYPVSADESLTEQKNRAMEAIAGELAASDMYMHVTIETKGIPEEEYGGELSEASASDKMPAIYELPDNGMEYLSSAEDLRDVVSGLDKSEYYFLSDYRDYFSEYKCLPTAFHVPIIYLNRSLFDNFENMETEIKVMSDYINLDEDKLEYAPISVKEDLYDDYCMMLDGFEGYQGLIDENGLSAFLAGDTIAYFSDTSDYFSVRDGMKGNVVMLFLDSNPVICSFANVYCISECDGATETAAKQILEYFLSSFAQESYYMQTNLSGLPLEKAILGNYLTVKQWQLEDILQNIDNYTFDQNP